MARITRVLIAQNAPTGRTGTLSVTLDDVTLSADGTLDISASASITLDAVSLASSGAVDVSGVLSTSLDALTLSSTGTLSDDSRNAILDKTLDDLTLSGAAETTLTATVAIALDALSVASAGAMRAQAALSRTLDGLGLSSTGTVATFVARVRCQMTLNDKAKTPVPNLTGLVWAWFDAVTPNNLDAPTDVGTGETTDSEGYIEVELPNLTATHGLAASERPGSMALQDQTGDPYRIYILETL